MWVLLILISSVALFLNFIGVPEIISQTSPIILTAEHFSVLFLSWYMIRKILRKYGIETQKRYYAFFLVGYTISLIYLHFGWTPELPYLKLANWGFDPQRYYYYATQLVNYGVVDAPLNYFGIVYILAGIMKIFGVDPLVPFYLNCILFLYAVLLLSRYLLIKPEYVKRACWLLLIPEILYFDALSSREVISMALVCIMLSKIHMYFVNRKTVDLAVTIIAFLTLFVIRPPMSFAFICSVACYLLMTRKGNGKIQAVLIVVILGLMVFVGNQLSMSMGSFVDSTGIIDVVGDKMSGDVEVDSSRYYASSLSAYLIPHNPLQFVVFGIIRSFCYVLITPAMIITPQTLVNFSTAQPTGFVNLTTLAFFLTLPHAIKICIRFKHREPSIQLLILTFIIYFFVVGMFNTTIIHPRYRIVYDLFYFSLVIVSYVDIKKKRMLKRKPKLN